VSLQQTQPASSEEIQALRPKNSIEEIRKNLIEEFNQIKADALAGENPALINRRYAAWKKRVMEATR